MRLRRRVVRSAVKRGRRRLRRARSCRIGRWPRWSARFACGGSAGIARSAESFFFPLDVRLSLGTEGYSPALLGKAVRQASKASSFAEASDDLKELADVEISP